MSNWKELGKLKDVSIGMWENTDEIYFTYEGERLPDQDVEFSIKIQDLEHFISKASWIDIDKQDPPTEEEEVWITEGENVMRAKVLGREKTGWSVSGFWGWVNITHWMPIEKPPLPNNPIQPTPKAGG